MKDGIQLSIIIPVYNGGEYLHRCLNSIVNQSGLNYEVLIINDGSTDNSKEIYSEFLSLHSNVFAYEQNNQGVSSARNLGIEKSRGKWLFFCDADDEMFPDALLKLSKILSNEVDLICTAYEIAGKGVRDIGLRNGVIDLEIMKRYLFIPPKNIYQGYLWSKLFRRSIIKNAKLTFNPLIKFNEDRLFIFEYLYYCRKSIYYFNYPIYKYYLNPTGAMLSVNRKEAYKNFQSDIDAFLRIREIAIEKSDDKLSDIINRYLYGSYIKNKRLIKENSDNSKHELILLKSKLPYFSILNRIKYLIKLRTLGLKYRIIALVN